MVPSDVSPRDFEKKIFKSARKHFWLYWPRYYSSKIFFQAACIYIGNNKNTIIFNNDKTNIDFIFRGLFFHLGTPDLGWTRNSEWLPPGKHRVNESSEC